MTFPRVLTIAGSDSGGGAGIQADLKTFTVLGAYGASVITALTAQNTRGVEGIADVDPAFVHAQMKAVLADIGADAIKTGMLSSAAIAEVVAQDLRGFAADVPLVIDPVMIAKSGHHLLQPEAVDSVVRLLLPLAAIVTPNIHEAMMITGMRAESDAEALHMADALLAMGPQAVLLKGGHRGVESCDDLFADRHGRREWLRAERLNQKHTHGTGCTLSAAIAAYLARGMDLLEACRAAKSFITGAIRGAFAVGGGTGPVNHLWQSGGYAARRKDA